MGTPWTNWLRLVRTDDTKFLHEISLRTKDTEFSVVLYIVTYYIVVQSLQYDICNYLPLKSHLFGIYGTLETSLLYKRIV